MPLSMSTGSGVNDLAAAIDKRAGTFVGPTPSLGRLKVTAIESSSDGLTDDTLCLGSSFCTAYIAGSFVNPCGDAAARLRSARRRARAPPALQDRVPRMDHRRRDRMSRSETTGGTRRASLRLKSLP